MAEITHNTEILLDRLYNLKGEDNIILKELSNKISETESEIELTEKNKTNSEINKVNSEGTLEIFLTQKQTFEEAFQGLDNDTFSALREIDVNLEIGSLLNAISERAPEYCDKLQTEINKFNTEINEAEEQRLNLNEELTSLNDQRNKVENDREQLQSLLEQSLSPNEIERDSLTAHYVKRIISPFDVFSEDELNKITKLIMFPDEGLYQFDETYEDRLRNGLVGLTKEITEEPIAVEEIAITPPIEEELTQSEETPVEEVAPVEEEPKEVDYHNVEEAQEIYGNDDDKTRIIDLSSLNRPEEPEEIIPPVIDLGIPQEEPVIELSVKQVVEEENIIEEAPIPQEEPVEQEVEEEIVPIIEPEIEVVEKSKEEIIEEFLNNFGFDIAKFQTENIEEVYELLNSVDERTVKENYEILRSISLEDEVYTIHNGHMYIADADFNKKLTLLRAKGVKENKIQELLKDPNSGLRDNFEIIEEKVTAIQNLNARIDDENIDLLKTNIAQYEKNLNLLASNGYELDEKEIRNHNLLLFESNNIYSNIEILKEYLISIVRNNGKYALSVFWKTPKELLTDIDSLIEADLENIISTNPETLSTQTTELINRVKYCEAKGEPIYEGNNQADFCKHISSYYEFYKKFGVVSDLPELISTDEVNEQLPSIIGNEELINILQTEYSNVENVIGINVLPEMQGELNRFNHLLEDKYNAKVIGKYTYKLGDVYISKNKFERNITILLNALSKDNDKINKLEKEIILAAALFNLRQPQEVLKELVNNFSTMIEISN